jgi:hypothetical protein
VPEEPEVPRDESLGSGRGLRARVTALVDAWFAGMREECTCSSPTPLPEGVVLPPCRLHPAIPPSSPTHGENQPK